MAVRDPKLIVPGERVLPEDQRHKYEARSLDELRNDVYKMFRRVEVCEKERDRLDGVAREQNDRLFRHTVYAMLLFAIDLIVIAWIIK